MSVDVIAVEVFLAILERQLASGDPVLAQLLGAVKERFMLDLHEWAWESILLLPGIKASAQTVWIGAKP
jgi:hypothetical protein